MPFGTAFVSAYDAAQARALQQKAQAEQEARFVLEQELERERLALQREQYERQAARDLEAQARAERDYQLRLKQYELDARRQAAEEQLRKDVAIDRARQMAEKAAAEGAPIGAAAMFIDDPEERQRWLDVYMARKKQDYAAKAAEAIAGMHTGPTLGPEPRAVGPNAAAGLPGGILPRPVGPEVTTLPQVPPPQPPDPATTYHPSFERKLEMDRARMARMEALTEKARTDAEIARDRIEVAAARAQEDARHHREVERQGWTRLDIERERVKLARYKAQAAGSGQNAVAARMQWHAMEKAAARDVGLLAKDLARAERDVQSMRDALDKNTSAMQVLEAERKRRIEEDGMDPTEAFSQKEMSSYTAAKSFVMMMKSPNSPLARAEQRVASLKEQVQKAREFHGEVLKGLTVPTTPSGNPLKGVPNRMLAPAGTGTQVLPENPPITPKVTVKPASRKTGTKPAAVDIRGMSDAELREAIARRILSGKK